MAEGARRELREETGIELGALPLEQLAAFDAIDRDPRERVISVVHVAFVVIEDHPLDAGDDASEARWFSLAALPPLAFDHAQVLARAEEKLRARWA